MILQSVAHPITIAVSTRGDVVSLDNDSALESIINLRILISTIITSLRGGWHEVLLEFGPAVLLPKCEGYSTIHLGKNVGQVFQPHLKVN